MVNSKKKLVDKKPVPIYQKRIQCMDCHCIGVLRQKKKKFFLLPEEVLSTRSIHTQKRDLKKKTFVKKINESVSLAKHGFATDKQQYTYLSLGSIFWITIMLIGRRESDRELVWTQLL